ADQGRHQIAPMGQGRRDRETGGEQAFQEQRAGERVEEQRRRRGRVGPALRDQPAGQLVVPEGDAGPEDEEDPGARGGGGGYAPGSPTLRRQQALRAGRRREREQQTGRAHQLLRIAEQREAGDQV